LIRELNRGQEIARGLGEQCERDLGPPALLSVGAVTLPAFPPCACPPRGGPLAP
jgi:hypothetical protein